MTLSCVFLKMTESIQSDVNYLPVLMLLVRNGPPPTVLKSQRCASSSICSGNSYSLVNVVLLASRAILFTQRVDFKLQLRMKKTASNWYNFWNAVIFKWNKLKSEVIWLVACVFTQHTHFAHMASIKLYQRQKDTSTVCAVIIFIEMFYEWTRNAYMCVFCTETHRHHTHTHARAGSEKRKNHFDVIIPNVIACVCVQSH